MINFFKSRLLLVVMIPIIGWLGFSFIKINLHNNLVNKDVEGLEAKIANLEEENSGLEKLIEYLNNPSFLDREVRANLNYKAPDEDVVFVYLDESPSVDSVPDDTSIKIDNLSNPLKWVYYLLGY